MRPWIVAAANTSFGKAVPPVGLLTDKDRSKPFLIDPRPRPDSSSIGMSVLMSWPTRDSMAMDADPHGENVSHSLNFGDEDPTWTNTTMKFGPPQGHPNHGSYRSFEWANIDHAGASYPDSSLLGSQRVGVPSFEIGSAPSNYAAPSYMSYPEPDDVANFTQYSSPGSTTSGNFNLTPSRGTFEFTNHKPKVAKKTSQVKGEPTSAPCSRLEVPKRPRPHRRHSDLSAVSSPSSAGPTDKGSGGGAGTGNVAAANEAHIIAERRYRNNLNAKIALIRSALENAQFRSQSKESYRSRGGTYFVPEATAQDGDPTSPTNSCGKDRRRKADILDEAAEYIRFADAELRHLTEEVQWLTQALAASQAQSY